MTWNVTLECGHETTARSRFSPLGHRFLCLDCFANGTGEASEYLEVATDADRLSDV